MYKLYSWCHLIYSRLQYQQDNFVRILTRPVPILYTHLPTYILCVVKNIKRVIPTSLLDNT